MLWAQTISVAPLREDAWRLALVWLGIVVILVAVICVAVPMLGIACIALGSVAILIPTLTSRSSSEPSAFLHGLCALLAAIAAFGLCASRCGSYAQYAEFLGIPTAIAASLLHGTAAILLTMRQRSERIQTISTAVTVTAIGGSLLFASIQLRLGIWCSACAAIHALMAVQAATLIRSQSGIRRATVVTGILAAAGLMNAVYHHGPQSAVPDDSQELLSYLRSAWTAQDPPQRIEVRDVNTDAVRREGIAIAQQLAAAAAAARTTPTPMTAHISEYPQLSQSTPVHSTAIPQKSQAAALRSIADANRWGSAQAPVTLLVKLDTGCPVCARQFAQLLELQDLVMANALQVHFLIGYRSDASQASASLTYVGGLVSDQALLAVLAEAFHHQSDILVPADAVATLPPILPAARALDLLRRHRDDVSALLADAQRMGERLGSTGDPTMWLLSAGDTAPRQHFDGLTLADVLRAAVAGVAHGSGSL